MYIYIYTKMSTRETGTFFLFRIASGKHRVNCQIKEH